MNSLLKVSIRQKAIFIPASAKMHESNMLSAVTAIMVANMAKLGFGVSEELLQAINHTTPAFQLQVVNMLKEISGIHKNWTPLVKAWTTPTGESAIDHVVTFFANVFKTPGDKLPCGHIIPAHTFPLERYNGCPFCGTPFVFGEIENYKQGSHMKVLELWQEKEIQDFFEDLLTSKTALDATQTDSLAILLEHFPLPDAPIVMKETRMLAIDAVVKKGNPADAQIFFDTPADILRYLWYRHTGYMQLVEPKTIIRRNAQNNSYRAMSHNNGNNSALKKAGLKLKYTRKECIMVAGWLNNLQMSAEKMCEIMHPKRSMWVRFIRALRLAEYSKRPGFGHLATVLDKFYKQDYQVWQGLVNQYRLRYDAATTFGLLQQRPGLFARSLFANMLWFGNNDTIAAFEKIIDQLPARLIFTLGMYADIYFSKSGSRTVQPLGGIAKNIPVNGLLSLYEEDQLQAMRTDVENLCLLAVQKRFTAQHNSNKTIYIDPALYKIPVSIGDRSSQVQDLPAALAGTRFTLEGDTIRLFMQWGTGLPAQHMDMDLSCAIAYDTRLTEHCSYSSLVATGCKHSGDIRSIPNQVGTAEYIDINIPELKKAGAAYVTFTCNAYSNGSITPNMVVGWMNSKYPMQVSERTGVAYDPSCVQHQVRITNPLTKGMVFGVLDVKNETIIWLEIPFAGQTVHNLNLNNVTAILKKLDSKLSIGNLLQIKAKAQNLQITDDTAADEVYTTTWAINTAAVTKLLID